MTDMTITEALAEIKTINKRLISKRDFVKKNLMRSDAMKDPMEKDGGSAAVLKAEMQSIDDLEERIVELRRAIQKANDTTDLTIEGVTQSITDWLVWRREVSDNTRSFLKSLLITIENVREQQRTWKSTVNEKPADIIVNLNEKSLADDYESMDKVLGQLDGLLSLKNATVMVH